MSDPAERLTVALQAFQDVYPDKRVTKWAVLRMALTILAEPPEERSWSGEPFSREEADYVASILVNWSSDDWREQGEYPHRAVSRFLSLTFYNGVRTEDEIAEFNRMILRGEVEYDHNLVAFRSIIAHELARAEFYSRWPES